MKKTIKLLIIVLFLIMIMLLVYPHIELNYKNKLIKFSYVDDYSEFEDCSCYDESYFYNKKRNISVYNFSTKKFLFFYVIILDYKEGNVCDTEYLLEEEYIENFLANATIKYNENNINIKELIKDKEAIVSNTRYFGNDYNNLISYILDGRHEELYVFYVDDLLVIQVGLSDESPKFIAYK